MTAPEALRLIPLELMQPGETGCIVDVDGRADVVHRLSEMGLSPRVAVRMIRSGQPCILALGDQRLSLRIDESLQILVEVE